jgi:hypothetical protein
MSKYETKQSLYITLCLEARNDRPWTSEELRINIIHDNKNYVKYIHRRDYSTRDDFLDACIACLSDLENQSFEVTQTTEQITSVKAKEFFN